MPLSVHLIRTRYPHWGAHSGINQFVRYLEPARFTVRERLVSDGDQDFPVRHGRVRERLRTAVQRGGMPWYQLSDLAAEIDAFRRSWLGPVDLIHYLDGEHSAQFLPRFRGLTRLRPRLVASYHQPLALLEKLVNRAIVARLDVVVLVSPVQVPYFQDVLGEERVRLVLHGIDADFFRPPPAVRAAQRFRCITVGHYLRDFAAVSAVAQRLERVRDVEFHVVSSRAEELAGRPNVTLHREVDDRELLRLYQESDVLVLPLLDSTINNALLEGIACGLPVISTALPSTRAYVPGAEAILLEGNDPDQLADAILRLAGNPTARRLMGHAARRRAEELDWRKIAPQYGAIYIEVTKRS
jgi:glycosyltransferase involved in cell wall biosynthesis